MKFVNVENGVERDCVMSDLGFEVTDRRTGRRFNFPTIKAITVDIYASDNWDENHTGSALVTFSDYTASSLNWASHFKSFENGETYVIVRA